MNFENNYIKVRIAIANRTRTRSKKNQRISPLPNRKNLKKSKISKVKFRNNN